MQRVMGPERLKQELLALEAANVHAILENEPLIDEVLVGLEAATNCVDDMDEWLGIFNVKLRHMRENIESMQPVNNKALIEELDKLLERLRVPSEVKEKRAELEKLKSTFVRRASEFLSNYFASLVDFMISDKSYFSQRGQLKRPDHADLRYKCRTYAHLLQHLKSLDKNFPGSLRKLIAAPLTCFFGGRFEDVNDDEKNKLSSELDELESEREQVRLTHQQAQRECHQEFHKVWGQLMKTGYQNSRCAHQVERFACLYTSQVSNLGLYSPHKYYRPSEDFMPHEFDIIPW
ncbi:exocyst complex component SEC3A isoform X3 [Fagus crenata]